MDLAIPVVKNAYDSLQLLLNVFYNEVSYISFCIIFRLYSDTSANEDNSFRNHIR